MKNKLLISSTYRLLSRNDFDLFSFSVSLILIFTRWTKSFLLLFCFCLFISSATPPRGSAPYTNLFLKLPTLFFSIFLLFCFLLCLEDF